MVIRVTGNDSLISRNNQVCLLLGYEVFLLYYEYDPDYFSIVKKAQFSVSGQIDMETK